MEIGKVMDNAEANKKAPEKSESCDSALTALSKDATNSELMNNVRNACAAHSDSLPRGMASSKELLSGADATEHNREMERLSTVDKALSRKNWVRNDSPDTETLEKTLREMSSEDRIKLQKDYADSKHEDPTSRNFGKIFYNFGRLPSSQRAVAAR